MNTSPLYVTARRIPLATMAAALALLDAKPKLNDAERQTRAVLMDVICEKSPEASAAFDAWAADDDAPPDGALPAILAAVTCEKSPEASAAFDAWAADDDVPAILAAVTARQTDDHPVVYPVADARDRLAAVTARQTDDHPVDPVADARDRIMSALVDEMDRRRERRAQRPRGGGR